MAGLLLHSSVVPGSGTQFIYYKPSHCSRVRNETHAKKGRSFPRAHSESSDQGLGVQPLATNPGGQAGAPPSSQCKLTRRHLSLLPVSGALLRAPSSLADESVALEKTKNLPLETLRDIIAEDIGSGQYFVTGNLTRSVYREDCKFKDPTNTTVGVGRYLAAVSILFDPEYSRVELLSIEAQPESGAVFATWRLGGYLKFPWRPRVEPFAGTTTYKVDGDGLVALHEETWSISPAAALLETFTPTFGPRQLL